MIRVEHVTKKYGDQVAVGDVSFLCETGTVTGFLGPNGAGKSTTMRIITGLTPADSGTSSIHGVPFAKLKNHGRQVGVLLDASAQHSGRSGREVLSLAAMTMGLPGSRVEEMLALVGLEKAARKRMGNYSLGMKQRLGIAYALLGDPNVLILDEPANGLDPEGIHWMRGLLRGFADRGGTVLLSSHLLREVEAVADHLVVIGGGRIAADGAKEELLAGSGTLVRGDDLEALGRALAAASIPVQRRSPDGGYVVDATARDVGLAAARAQVALLELRPADGGGLEELFLTLTGTAPAPTAAAPAAEEILQEVRS